MERLSRYMRHPHAGVASRFLRTSSPTRSSDRSAAFASAPALTLFSVPNARSSPSPRLMDGVFLQPDFSSRAITLPARWIASTVSGCMPSRPKMALGAGGWIRPRSSSCRKNLARQMASGDRSMSLQAQTMTATTARSAVRGMHRQFISPSLLFKVLPSALHSPP